MSDRKWYNPLVTWLLRSPLHGLMSQSTVLVTITGRKSGRPYTLPISYHLADGTLTLVTRRDKSWWRNVRGGAPVQVRLRGEEMGGHAEVVALSETGMVAAIEQIWPNISPELAQETAGQAVLVQIHLTPATVRQMEAERSA